MRRLAWLLCLLVVAALGRVIRSAEACTSREQVDAVFPSTHLALKAGNMGFPNTSVAAGIRCAEAAWITYERLSPAMEPRPHSTRSILSRLNQRVRFELMAITAGRVENTPFYHRPGLIGVANLSVTLRNNGLTRPPSKTEF
jgi:hypothetical protein